MPCVCIRWRDNICSVERGTYSMMFDSKVAVEGDTITDTSDCQQGIILKAMTICLPMYV